MSLSRLASSCLTSSPPTPAGAQPGSGESEIVGSSAAMKRLRQQVRRIGPHFRAVLVSGEAGTGKELVARALHSVSPAATGPFVLRPAASMNDTFAKHKGSDGTYDDVASWMGRSVRGTLFLDRVHDLSLEAQGWLLRALAQHELAQKTELRVIASAAGDLRILVSAGRFSQDLYQRLATVEITLPPLRERMEDVPELARHFLQRIAQFSGRAVLEIADETMEQMQRYPWPGNVGELEIVIRNGVLRSEGEVIEARHLTLFAEPRRPEHSMIEVNKSVRLQDVVEQHVLQVLKDCRGNKLRASEMLGISRSTLYRMLEAGVSADNLR
jgi:DNA-binding NtrC family response regulator